MSSHQGFRLLLRTAHIFLLLSFVGVALTSSPIMAQDIEPVLVKDIIPGVDSASYSHLVDVNGKLFFFANDKTEGYGLWVSDGTAEGTIRLKSLYSTSGSAAMNGKAYFIVNDQLLSLIHI